MSATGTEKRVCEDIAKRQELGIAKYKTTVEDNPLSLRQWLQHAYEETLDQAIYLKRSIEEIDIQDTPFVSATYTDEADERYSDEAHHAIMKLCPNYSPYHKCGVVLDKNYLSIIEGYQARIMLNKQKLDSATESFSRQADNMAFVLNRVNMPDQWHEKLARELEEDSKSVKNYAS